MLAHKNEASSCEDDPLMIRVLDESRSVEFYRRRAVLRLRTESNSKGLSLCIFAIRREVSNLN